MAFVHELHKCRRRNADAVAGASFLLLVLIFSVVLVATPPHAGPTVGAAGTFFSGAASPVAPAPSSQLPTRPQAEQLGNSRSCAADLRSLPDHAARCRYLSSPGHPPCAPRGYVSYLRAFYCAFGAAPGLGAAALALWLLLLFYLLGDTASRYFCAALEGLAGALRLPPAVAGATLLALGNGAPDVLSSVVAFAAASGGGEGATDVGLGGILGGALFVSTVVAGVVAIVAAGRGEDAAVTVERRGFLRDVCFLLVALGYLLAVLRAGSVTVWAAASFLSLYAAYVLLVWASHCCAPLAEPPPDPEDGKKPDLERPLLLDAAPARRPPVSCPTSSSSSSKHADPRSRRSFPRRALDALQLPLSLPRRLTIPDISARHWSKRYAVASAFLSPLLLCLVTLASPAAALLSGALLGLTLAALAALRTDASSPPSTPRARLPWLAGGFLMSVLWSYLLARELVSLLASIALVAGVPAGALGATVLAWGNSLGDLAADVAMAARGSAQTAVAGCYAGPAFNTVVGLGLALTLAAGARYPRAYEVPAPDAAAYQAAGFLAAGLVWALVVLPARGMRLDRVLGVGLLLVYLGFLAVRLGSLSLGPLNWAS